MVGRLPSAMVVVCCALAGCNRDGGSGLGAKPAGKPGRAAIPAGVAGTVAEYSYLVGYDSLGVQGYGLVVGLGKAGSSEVPPALRKYLTEEMLKHKLDSPMSGTDALSPARMLADPDTAVVAVRGRIPPVAPPGTHFDLYVEALPGTQTVSLDGGVLMTAELHLALDGSITGGRKTKSWALGRGAVFVNPFIGRGTAADKARLRAGHIPNGGVVARKQPTRLELHRRDYRMAFNIQEQINRRFARGLAKVAVAKSSSVIDLTIPPAWQRDYEHFLSLVMHVYVLGGPETQERCARELAQAIGLPMARHDDISLVWEAMGREVLPVIQPLYASENAAAAFHAARAGLRLGDPVAVEPMIFIAKQADSPCQLQAVRELGRARQFVQGVGTLKHMLSSSSQTLRVAAYEALRDRGPSSAIRRRDVSGQFELDVVESGGDYAVYATSTGVPRIVLFGRDMPTRRPVFFCPPDELVTINALNEDADVSVYRKVPRSGRMSDTYKVRPLVEELILKLGQLPTQGLDGQPQGLGLTYSQVVGVVYGLSEAGHIPAKFVLQPSPEVRRIYASTPAMGRPDMPDEDSR